MFIEGSVTFIFTEKQKQNKTKSISILSQNYMIGFI